ncbi:ABC transporter G family member 11 [Selaginella moellendorffii]|uniref:ABC transporter G family member 11 n=1 Tax=Selaginella moellendorffii TaxID=88036 RepID=UPI000D1C5B55|nr:ABC transporter G family member 11 [Selaginella moellendorffii]|eukprot:XP_002970205.2 ABC transporter G family member 11 [Selaginella moellendorffii]
MAAMSRSNSNSNSVPHGSHARMERSAAQTNTMGMLSPLSLSLWKNKTGDEETDISARLTWRDLFVSATNAKGETRSLLHGLNGYAEPGYLMAVMGPSGSGKSTLLDALAGRLAKNTTQSGEVLLNGRRTRLSYGIVAFVTQDDALIGTLTVKETITYSAKLRLPDLMPRKDKKAIVESTIMEMGLQECQNTPVGNWHLRGLSGGEKRRLSIGLEILTRPRLLFLDEPTSGLDSASAFFVTQTLKNLARDGRTVIASIHQPSSEVFELFDRLYLLSHGKTIYFGDAPAAKEFFASAGFPCPPLRNPSDHYLRAINSDFDRVKDALRNSFVAKDMESADVLDKTSTAQVIKILIDHYQSSEHAMLTASKIHEINQTKGVALESEGSQASFFMQSFTLTRRSFVNMSRDMGYYWLRLVIYIILAIGIGTLYYDIGTSYSSIMARAACMSFVGGFLIFMSIGGFPSFIEDMKVFSRERLNGHYGVVAFVVGNTLSSLPFLFLIALVSGAITYNMVKLHPGFIRFSYFVLNLFAAVAAVESLMMAVASLVPNFLMGIITGAGIQGIFLLVAGFFRLPGDLPKAFWKFPLSYIGFHMYSLQGNFENDFLGLNFENKFPGLPKIPGKFILQDVYEIPVGRSKWWNLAVVFLMIIVYRFLFFLAIKYSESVQPWLQGIMAKRRARFLSSNHLTRKNSALQNTIRPVVQQSPLREPATATS